MSNLEISPKANVAITMAKAFHMLATCLGDKDMIDNAQEHLDVALDFALDKETRYSLDATRFAIEVAMRSLIDSVE